MFSSRPKGQVISSSPLVRQMNSLIASTATLDATSPAACPPMPSATTKSFCSGLTQKLSSLPLRLRPTSVTASHLSFMDVLGSSRAEALGDAAGQRLLGIDTQGLLHRLLGAKAKPLLQEERGQLGVERR